MSTDLRALRVAIERERPWNNEMDSRTLTRLALLELIASIASLESELKSSIAACEGHLARLRARTSKLESQPPRTLTATEIDRESIRQEMLRAMEIVSASRRGDSGAGGSGSDFQIG